MNDHELRQLVEKITTYQVATNNLLIHIKGMLLGLTITVFGVIVAVVGAGLR